MACRVRLAHTEEGTGAEGGGAQPHSDMGALWIITRVMWEDSKARKERPRTWLLWNRVKLTRSGPGQHHSPEDQLAQSGSPSPCPALGNNLGAGQEDRETHCVRYMFMKYSTAMKAQHLLLQTGGSQHRYDKQATQTRLPKGEAPLPPSVLLPSLAPDFPLLPGCLLLVHPTLGLLSSTPPGALTVLRSGLQLNPSPRYPSPGPGGRMPPSPLGCFVLWAPWGSLPHHTHWSDIWKFHSTYPRIRTPKASRRGQTENSH